MSFRILHPFSPTVRPADQVATWAWLHEAETLGKADVKHAPCLSPKDYAIELNRHWSFYGDLVIVEHDIVPSHDSLYEFATCPRPFCAADYRLSSGELWSEVADHDCLGLVRMTRRLRESVSSRPSVPQVPYGDLAHALGERLGMRAHLHGAVTHNHSLEAMAGRR